MFLTKLWPKQNNHEKNQKLKKKPLYINLRKKLKINLKKSHKKNLKKNESPNQVTTQSMSLSILKSKSFKM